VTQPINKGGTGEVTEQAAIGALSAVSGATNEHVLTKDTGSGNAVWKEPALTGQFVDRGDPASNDFDVGDFTTDAAFHDLDLSNIVPSNAVAVVLKIVISSSDTAGASVLVRKNGNANTPVGASARTQVIGVPMDQNVIVACDTSQVVEYRAADVTWTLLRITVQGWFLG
jgi:hypothetical protein